MFKVCACVYSFVFLCSFCQVHIVFYIPLHQGLSYSFLKGWIANVLRDIQTLPHSQTGGLKKKKKNVCGAPIKPHLQKQAVGQSLPIPNFMFLLAEIMHKLNTKFGFCSIISQYIHCVGTNSHFQNKYYSRIDCTSEFSH